MKDFHLYILAIAARHTTTRSQDVIEELNTIKGLDINLGSIYSTLKRQVRDGYLTSARDPRYLSSPRAKTYTITPKGIRKVQIHIRNMRLLYQGIETVITAN